MKKRNVALMFSLILVLIVCYVGIAMVYDRYFFNHNSFSSMYVYEMEELGKTENDTSNVGLLRTWAEENSATIFHMGTSVVAYSVIDGGSKLPCAEDPLDTIFVSDSHVVTTAYISDSSFIPFGNDEYYLAYYSADYTDIPTVFQSAEFLYPIEWNDGLSGLYMTDGDINGLANCFKQLGCRCNIRYTSEQCWLRLFGDITGGNLFAISILTVLFSFILCTGYIISILYRETRKYIRVHCLYGESTAHCCLNGMLQSLLVAVVSGILSYISLGLLLTMYDWKLLFVLVSVSFVAITVILLAFNIFGLSLVKRNMRGGAK